MKNIILNRNGQGEVRSEWYATTYDNEIEARDALERRSQESEKAQDGWDAELLLCDENTARNILEEED